MSAHNYTLAEFRDYTPQLYRRKALAAGYTNPVLAPSGDPVYPIRLAVNETVDRSVLRDDVVAQAEPVLQVNVQRIEIAGDGVSTGQVTITDTRGAGAAGKTVNLMALNGPLVCSPGSQVLDGAGQATFTFGPSWAPGVHSGQLAVRFMLADDTARPTQVGVYFTG